METLILIKDLVEKMSVDTRKVFKGNHSASIRARKTAQDIKELIRVYRKEILTEIKKHDEINHIRKIEKKQLKENGIK